MKSNPTRSALLLIDMENSFVDPRSRFCIRGAQATIPSCSRALDLARSKGIPIFFVKRIYRGNGVDVELSRYSDWRASGYMDGHACAHDSRGSQHPPQLQPQPGDYTIIKHRFSAFFQTELDLLLRRLDIRTVILAGTTTPNCIRTTCYDALSLEYNVVVLTDCCSSQTEEIQRVNLADMQQVGAIMMDSGAFALYNADTVPDLSATVREEIEGSSRIPEPFDTGGFSSSWRDIW